jgi:hypothetical protein
MGPGDGAFVPGTIGHRCHYRPGGGGHRDRYDDVVIMTGTNNDNDPGTFKDYLARQRALRVGRRARREARRAAAAAPPLTPMPSLPPLPLPLTTSTSTSTSPLPLTTSTSTSTSPTPPFAATHADAPPPPAAAPPHADALVYLLSRIVEKLLSLDVRLDECEIDFASQLQTKASRGFRFPIDVHVRTRPLDKDSLEYLGGQLKVLQRDIYVLSVRMAQAEVAAGVPNPISLAPSRPPIGD